MTQQERIDAGWEPMERSPFGALWRAPDQRMWIVRRNGSQAPFDTVPGVPHLAFRLAAVERAFVAFITGTAQERNRIATEFTQLLAAEDAGDRFPVVPNR